MEDYLYIVEWVIRAVVFLYAVITTVILAIKKIKANKAAGEEVDTFDIASKAFIDCAGLILKNEKLFESITKDGAKTGSLKSFMTQEEMKSICAELNIPYNSQNIQQFINAVVELMNCNKNDSVHSSGQSVIDDKNNIIISEE